MNACTGRNEGFGLVELLVAMALGIILSLGVVEIYINSKQTFNQQEGVSRLQENARYAMNRIFKSASSAGYMGCLSAKASDVTVVQTNTLTINTGNFDFTVPVGGVEGGTLDSLTFKRTLGYQGIELDESMAKADDPIELDPNDFGYGDLEPFDVMMVGDCEHVSVFMITNDPQASGGTIEHATGVANDGQSNTTSWLGQVYKVDDQNASSAMALKAEVVTYSIDKGTGAPGACSAANPGYCSLFQQINGAARQELVQGVHGLNAWYGQDTNGDTQADIYRDASAVTDWAEVVSVRVTLSLNTVERVQGSASGAVTTTKDITQVFRLRSRGL